MNTKISEAAVEAAIKAYENAIVSPTMVTNSDFMRAAITAALPHLRPQRLPSSRGVGITADWVLGYLCTDAPEDSREAVRNAFTEWNALAATGKQQGGENPAWRDELVREAHARGLMEGLNSPRPQQVGEVQGDAPDPSVIVPTLRAMVRNYSDGHRWDHLDARMCQAAADRIEMLEAALSARQPGAQVPVCFIPPKDAELLRRREFSLRSMCSAWEPPSYENNWVGVYLAAPPAQGNDLEQFRKLAMPVLCPSLCASDAERMCSRLHAALIDDQRDAAPGVGNG